MMTFLMMRHIHVFIYIGDLGFDPLDLKKKLKFDDDQELFDEMKLRELKNGRLAMIGTSALLLQEVVTGLGPYEQLLKK
jgi:hypothetical protein